MISVKKIEWIAEKDVNEEKIEHFMDADKVCIAGGCFVQYIRYFIITA